MPGLGLALSSAFWRSPALRFCQATLSSVRNYSCIQKDNKKCNKPFNDFPCGKPELMRKKKSKSKQKKFESMWFNPFCHDDDVTCPFNPRFDDLYYKESDKAKRKYWQTWVQCPPIKIKKKKICCYKNAKAPPMKRRCRKKPKTACPRIEVCEDTKCPRAKRRCHKAGRIPPSCKHYPSPKDCTKPLAPYPAFSECVRLKPSELPLSECICWNKPMLCEVWAEWRRRENAKFNKK